MKKTQDETSFAVLSKEWQEFIESLSDDKKSLFISLDHIGQLEILNHVFFSNEIAESTLHALAEIEEFYRLIGGIKGYQKALKETKEDCVFDKQILEAPKTAITDNIQTHIEAIRACLENLPHLAEVYAIGGAADRLNLKSGSCMLPAACLKIAGKTLLEYLLHDLEAKEWLYYKCYGKTLTLPIVMMTSFEKDNQAHIFNILKQHNFFDRDEDRFLIFHQPLVPMVDENLNWQVQKNAGLFLKPGGHGAIWGLFAKEKIFERLRKFGSIKLSIRQINNPIACVDFGHAAFLGYGFLQNASFGFFACERFAGSQEGINVLLKNKNGQYSLTNIEYCQLENCGINDKPNSFGYSQFPANTNVLFADLEKLEKLTLSHPLPGKILNYKNFALDGTIKPLARLETMMQNMADYILEDGVPLKNVYMTLSKRQKTISPVKRQKLPGGSYDETPQACFYDFMKNAADLLHVCDIEAPKLASIEDYYKAPSFVFLYLPAMGPIYEIIRQKLKKGRLAFGSYLNLEIAEANIENLDLDGALSIKATHPYGVFDQKRIFSEKTARVDIQNCIFKNKGMDVVNSSHLYQDGPVFLEKCEIILEGFSEFHAHNVAFKGNYLFRVPHGYRLDVTVDENGKLKTHLTQITHQSFETRYIWGKDCLLIEKTIHEN